MPTKDKDFKTTTMPILDFNLNHPPKQIKKNHRHYLKIVKTIIKVTNLNNPYPNFQTLP